MVRNIFIVSLVCLFISCRPQRRLIQSSVKDSVNIEVKEVERIVRIPADSTSISMQAIVTGIPEESYKGVEFIPQSQTVETKRTKVKLSVNSKGEITATAICKELEEKVKVLEKTISNYKKEVSVLSQSETAFKRAFKTAKTILNTILYTVVTLLGLYVFIRFRSGILSFIRKIFNTK
jgi:hypothetical protein